MRGRDGNGRRPDDDVTASPGTAAVPGKRSPAAQLGAAPRSASSEPELEGGPAADVPPARRRALPSTGSFLDILPGGYAARGAGADRNAETQTGDSSEAGGAEAAPRASVASLGPLHLRLVDAFRRSARLDAPPDEIAQAGFVGASSEVPHRAEMEHAFGQSFGGVTAHRGEVAQAAAFSLGAQAYALGDHIVFADDDPSKEVVAHELTHVVQQRGGQAPAAVQAKSALSSSGDAHELEADRVAGAVSRGEPAGPISEAPRADVSRLDAWDFLNIGTGGAGVERAVTKGSPGLKLFNDLTSSMVLAVKYMPDEFKALFPAKDDIAGWWSFIQVAEGLLGAQVGVLILTGAPETFATKLAALVLEALIITFLIVMSVQLGIDSVETASKWLDKVKAGEVDAAAKLFAHLVANLIQIIGAVADIAKVAAPKVPKDAPKRPVGSVEEPVPDGKAQKAIEHAQTSEHHVAPPTTEQVPEKATEPEHETRGEHPEPGTREETSAEYKQRSSRERAERNVENTDQPLDSENAAHGHAKHGHQTTVPQQAERVRSGRTPGQEGPLPVGQKMPARASRFGTPQQEAEALARARRELDRRLAAGTVPNAPTYIDAHGDPTIVKIPVSTNRPEGFGTSEVAMRIHGQKVKVDGYQVPVTDPTRLGHARVTFEYVPSTRTWKPLTYFPEP